MNLIIDANILFAALIKENLTYNLFFDNRFNLFTPEYIFTELEEHKEEIMKKTEKTQDEFIKVLNMLENKISLVPLEELIPYVKKAEKLTPDPDDMAYFALALKLNCAIWSNDKKLKKQNKIEIYNTEELIHIINSN